MKKPSWTKVSGILVTLLIMSVAGSYLMSQEPKTTPTVKETQQYTNLEIAQFYLHLPGDDFIIGRASDKFNKLSNIVVKTAISLNEPVPELANWPEILPEGRTIRKTEGKNRTKKVTTQKSASNETTNDLKSIQDIKDKTVSLSVWLMEPQKISTRNKADVGLPKDKYGNSVVTTNRLMFVLSGKYMGTVFIRNDETGTWSVWDIEKGSTMPLVELVRSGDL